METAQEDAEYMAEELERWIYFLLFYSCSVGPRRGLPVLFSQATARACTKSETIKNLKKGKEFLFFWRRNHHFYVVIRATSRSSHWQSTGKDGVFIFQLFVGPVHTYIFEHGNVLSILAFRPHVNGVFWVPESRPDSSFEPRHTEKQTFPLLDTINYIKILLICKNCINRQFLSQDENGGETMVWRERRTEI